MARGNSFGVWHRQAGSGGGDYIYGSAADVGQLLANLVGRKRVDFCGSLSGAKAAASAQQAIAGAGRVVCAAEELTARGGLPYEPDPNAKPPELFMGFSYLSRGPLPGRN